MDEQEAVRVAKVQKSDVVSQVDRASKVPTMSADDFAASAGLTPGFLFSALRKAGIPKTERRTLAEWQQVIDAARNSAA